MGLKMQQKKQTTEEDFLISVKRSLEKISSSLGVISHTLKDISTTVKSNGSSDKIDD